MHSVMRSLYLFGAVMICALSGCSRNDRWYEQGQSPETQWEKAGLSFVQELMSRDFTGAHERLSSELQKSLTTEDLETATRRLLKERVVGTNEPWVLSSIERWPAKQPTDLGMAYVQIGGDGNEAITVTMTLEASELRVREIAWGRP